MYDAGVHLHYYFYGKTTIEDALYIIENGSELRILTVSTTALKSTIYI